MKPAGDFTARLTMPFFCPILPNTPAAEIDHPAGSGPYYFAERIVNQRIVLERNPFYRGDRPANVDRIVWTPGDDASRHASRRSRTTALDLCGEPGAPRTAYRALAEKYGLNRPGGRLFVRPAASGRGSSPSTTTGRRSRARADPAQESDQLRDRPACAHTCVRRPRRQAHRPDAPPGARASGEHLPTRRRRSCRGAPLVRAGAPPAHEARPLCMDDPSSR